MTVVCLKMSDQSDSQNRSEEHVQLSEGSDPSSTSDDGSRSTPSNLPKAATRTRKKRTSDSEDEDYVATEEEVSSKKKVLKKEYGTAAAVKPGMKGRLQQREFLCLRPEPLLKRQWSSLLNPKKLEREKGERKESSRPLPESLASPP